MQLRLVNHNKQSPGTHASGGETNTRKTNFNVAQRSNVVALNVPGAHKTASAIKLPTTR